MLSLFFNSINAAARAVYPVTSEGGLKRNQIINDVRRSRFSTYLNYSKYDPETKCYVNQDETLGFLWECSPLVFAGSKAMRGLEGIFRAGLPDNSVVSFMLYADDYIDPILNEYKAGFIRDNEVAREQAEQFCNFLESGAKNGLDNIAGTPVRNFRLILSVKIPLDSEVARGDGWKDIQKQIYETLNGSMMGPQYMEPDDLLEFLRRLFNKHCPGNIRAYNDEIPIRQQIINAETVIEDQNTRMKVGDNYFYCLTPKSHAPKVSALKSNSIVGGIEGFISDSDQIKTPFLYTVNVVIESLRSKLHTKCNLVLQQQGVGSFSASLQRKQVEYLRATDALEKKIQFVRVMPIFWVWDKDENKALDSQVRSRRLWENAGHVMQQDQRILKAMFISALPMNLYNHGKTLDELSRDFIAPISSVIPTLPIQGDFAGSGSPAIIGLGRKGQIISLDLFHKKAPNHNALIAATSGGGKSFLCNYICFNYFNRGAKIRIVDLGDSYKKMTNLVGAKYLDFSKENRICLNPFTNITEPEEELETAVGAIMQMAYSSSKAYGGGNVNPPTDVEINLARMAVNWAWAEYGTNADSTPVYQFLLNFPNVPGIQDGGSWTPSMIDKAKEMAFNIRDFTKGGMHEQLFTGPSTFNIRDDDFVVLELEALSNQKALYEVCTFLVLDAVTKDLYLGDRSRQKIILFDEAWKFLRDDPMIKKLIEEGYRKARKANGSFNTVTQSVLDVNRFGSVGDVIFGQSAFKFFLESSDFRKAADMKILDYDPFLLDLLDTLKSRRPQYSEIFADTPFAQGIMRLVVDPYTYYVATSSADETTQIDNLLTQGMSYDGAIKEMVRRNKQYRA